MRAIDDFLTRKAAATWPGATVTKQIGAAAQGEPTGYVLYRTEAPALGLGETFHRARMALSALTNQQQSLRRAVGGYLKKSRDTP